MVYLRKGIYYTDVVHEGGRIRRSTGTADREEAQRIEDAIREKLRDPVGRAEQARANEQTIGAIAERLAQRHIAAGKDPMETPRSLLYLAGVLGSDRPGWTIDDDCISRLVVGERIKSVVNEKRIRNLSEPQPIGDFLRARNLLDAPGDPSLKTLNSILDEQTKIAAKLQKPRVPLADWQVKSRIIDMVFMIVREVQYPNGFEKPSKKNHRYKDKPRRRVLDHREEIRLEKVAHPDVFAAYLFAIESMLRLSDICRLRWADIDIGTGVLSSKSKRQKQIFVRVERTLSQILERQMRLKTPTVFSRICKSTGHRIPMTPAWLSGQFQRDRKAAGLDHICFHDLRRTGATRHYDANKDIQAVQLALSHSNTTTTWRYIGKRPGLGGDAARRRQVFDDAKRQIAAQLESGDPVRIPTATQMEALPQLYAIGASTEGAELIIEYAALLQKGALAGVASEMRRYEPALKEVAGATPSPEDDSAPLALPGLSEVKGRG